MQHDHRAPDGFGGVESCSAPYPARNECAAGPTQAYDGSGRGLRTVEAFEAGSNRATFVCCAVAFLGDAAEAKGQVDQRATHSM